jgi:hypothetical protein
MAGAKKDDLEAVRDIADILLDFKDDERERILRWVRERIGMASSPGVITLRSPGVAVAGTGVVTAGSGAIAVGGGPPIAVAAGADIKSFVASKKPRTDTQFAAVVAYFHSFVATGDARKDRINSDDLVDACRKADWKRPARPVQVLVNAFLGGLLDRADKGNYRLSSVGENLVAMALPDGDVDKASSVGKRGRKKGKKK